MLESAFGATYVTPEFYLSTSALRATCNSLVSILLRQKIVVKERQKSSELFDEKSLMAGEEGVIEVDGHLCAAGDTDFVCNELVGRDC